MANLALLPTTCNRRPKRDAITAPLGLQDRQASTVSQVHEDNEDPTETRALLAVMACQALEATKDLKAPPDLMDDLVHQERRDAMRRSKLGARDLVDLQEKEDYKGLLATLASMVLQAHLVFPDLLAHLVHPALREATVRRALMAPLADQDEMQSIAHALVEEARLHVGEAAADLVVQAIDAFVFIEIDEPFIVHEGINNKRSFILFACLLISLPGLL